MHSTSSYIFSNDARATAFRRAVRSRVAHNQEYVLPGSGPSAQEVQQAYLRYCREQQSRGQSDDTQQAPPPYMPSADTLAPPSYTMSRDDQTPPRYTFTPASGMTPTAQLNFLLYSNTSTPPSPPEYAEAISLLSPPSYNNVISARTPTTSISRSTTSTNQILSRTSMSTIFDNCTTRAPKKHIHNKAIQALELVVLPGNGIEVIEKHSPTKKTGILGWMKGTV
ncbi:hypothetical protein KCU65_g5773, partial [Aureobasidium melanogenum]